MVKCLAQGHKRCDRPGRDSNPHSDNIRTWVQCTRPLGHDTPISADKLTWWLDLRIGRLVFGWISPLFFSRRPLPKPSSYLLHISFLFQMFFFGFMVLYNYLVLVKLPDSPPWYEFVVIAYIVTSGMEHVREVRFVDAYCEWLSRVKIFKACSAFGSWRIFQNINLCLFFFLYCWSL